MKPLLSSIFDFFENTESAKTHNRAIFEKYPGRVFACENEHCQEVIDEGIDVTL